MDYDGIMCEVRDTIEAGTSLTMQDLSEEAQATVRAHCALHGIPLPLPDGEQ